MHPMPPPRSPLPQRGIGRCRQRSGIVAEKIGQGDFDSKDRHVNVGRWCLLQLIVPFPRQVPMGMVVRMTVLMSVGMAMRMRMAMAPSGGMRMRSVTPVVAMADAGTDKNAETDSHNDD